MNQREKIIRYYKADGNSDLAAKLLDCADIVLRNRKYKVTEFLDPLGLSIAETIACQYGLQLDTNGGYHGAERVKAVFFDADFPGRVEFDIAALEICWDGRYYHLTHRDVLGAVMGLSIKREVLGDIIMLRDGCQIIVDRAMIDFLAAALLKIGAASIETKTIGLTEIAPREEKVKEIKATVPSLRLDAVAAAGFGTSRTKMAADIQADKVKLNWQETHNSSTLVKENDIISMRGRGRMEIAAVVGKTKKGRVSVVLKRFI